MMLKNKVACIAWLRLFAVSSRESLLTITLTVAHSWGRCWG